EGAGRRPSEGRRRTGRQYTAQILPENRTASAPRPEVRIRPLDEYEDGPVARGRHRLRRELSAKRVPATPDAVLPAVRQQAHVGPTREGVMALTLTLGRPLPT